MSETPLPDLVLYGRAECDLCAEARSIVVTLLQDRLARGLACPTLIERDIDADPAWHEQFFATIPVLELGDRRLVTVTSLTKVRRLLVDVLDAVPA